MNGRTLKALEYGKVIRKLAEFCVSEPGKQLALALRPASCAEAREAALLFEEVRSWSANAGEDGKPYSVGPFTNIRHCLNLIASGGALPDTEDLWTVRAVLRETRRAGIAVGETGDGQTYPRLAALAAFPLPEQSLSALERCLGDDGLRDESSPELLAARQNLRSLHQSCLRKVRDFAVQYNMEQYLQDEIMSLASDRYVLPLKADFIGKMQGVIHHWSQTGESCWFEPLFLVDINNRIQELKQREREEERKVLSSLASLIRAEHPFAEAALNFLARLDLLLGQCALAEAMQAVCPALGEEGGVELLEARHPLLALAGEARPVDILLHPGQRALVVSGGNAGGKTVCLKTLGLIVAMALTGLPVPVARGSRLPAWHEIHAFIGDEQSLDDKLSTFTAQIRHLGEVWESLDSRALVLLDEFGAGTDPAQGAALAQAVLDEVLERGAFVAAATHFPALKLHALRRADVRSASVLFEPETKRPLFRLAYDQVGEGRALDAARDYGLPEAVLRRAEEYMLPGMEEAGRVMARLNELAVERETEIRELRQEREQERERNERLRTRFARERRELHDEVRAKAQKLMRDWKESRMTRKQALKETARLRAALAPESAPEVRASPLLELMPGLRVIYRPFGRQGLVMEYDTRKNRARLDMNGVSLWASSADIHIPEQQAEGAEWSGPRGSGPRMPARLDLRGKRADEAMSELGVFLDKALLGGNEEVEILHGRGTGVLRREVRDFLKAFPGIAVLRSAPEDRGGDGVTLVTFV